MNSFHSTIFSAELSLASSDSITLQFTEFSRPMKRWDSPIRATSFLFTKPVKLGNQFKHPVNTSTWSELVLNICQLICENLNHWHVVSFPNSVFWELRTTSPSKVYSLSDVFRPFFFVAFLVSLHKFLTYLFTPIASNTAAPPHNATQHDISSQTQLNNPQ